MSDQSKTNVTLLKGLCVVLPSVTLVAAHFFPWRRLLGRELYRLETYAIGTAAIVGTASLAISVSDGDREDHVVMLNMAASSAGFATTAAYIVDAFIRLWAKIANLEAQNKALGDNGNL